jgi:hypothetical protein
MRLEGRSTGCERSSGKQKNEAYHASVRECALDYISPARLMPRHRDVASASELPSATEFVRRRRLESSAPRLLVATVQKAASL